MNDNNIKYDILRRKEEIKEKIWAELFTKDDYWRKELSPEDKRLLKEVEEDLKRIHIK